MSAIENLRISAIGLSILLLIVGGMLLFPNAREYLAEVFGEGSVQEVDFSTLEPDEQYDYFLLCPTDICLSATNFSASENFNISVTKLRDNLLEFTDSLPTVSVRSFEMENQQFEFIERSPVRRFPDIITVRIFDRGLNRSTIAIYSRSFSSGTEKGSNERRVKRWLRMISPNELA